MSSDAANKHLLIGLTGGIGSGKSTAAELFAKQGARIIDTDELSHQLTQSGGAAIAAIRDTFGSEYIDTTGALDRSKMRALVFTDAAEKARRTAENANQHRPDLLSGKAVVKLGDKLRAFGVMNMPLPQQPAEAVQP